ncbi:hypothetical protein P691DRAFT_760941 [Macrolepiota fuliginosa MF-IS2]|uniref:PSP proline-rich domain-containing protein n=1 Tax=Macrolepiota fuliginosa MF-IS2 TaxID=1400762 RepID=A0A9P5XCX5_9AGAR|nr:hypothetical protein P691DRAFT_760941 [Macrolepiota fuliginosa MF-IS2]
MHDAVKEEVSTSLRAKTGERAEPKIGKIDINYQKLHDAFFKFQTKSPMTGFGEMNVETSSKEKRPGNLSPELVESLSIPPFAPPHQRAMIWPTTELPDAQDTRAECAHSWGWGFYPGGWGKPPLDEYNRPLYGVYYRSWVNRSKKTMASVVSTIAGGLETPDFPELRKNARPAAGSGTGESGPRSLYHVVPEKCTNVRGITGSERGYDVAAIAGAAIPVLGGERVRGNGVDVPTDAANLDDVHAKVVVEGLQFRNAMSKREGVPIDPRRIEKIFNGTHYPFAHRSNGFEAKSVRQSAHTSSIIYLLPEDEVRRTNEDTDLFAITWNGVDVSMNAGESEGLRRKYDVQARGDAGVPRNKGDLSDMVVKEMEKKKQNMEREREGKKDKFKFPFGITSSQACNISYHTSQHPTNYDRVSPTDPTATKLNWPHQLPSSVTTARDSAICYTAPDFGSPTIPPSLPQVSLHNDYNTLYNHTTSHAQATLLTRDQNLGDNYPTLIELLKGTFTAGIQSSSPKSGSPTFTSFASGSMTPPGDPNVGRTHAADQAGLKDLGLSRLEDGALQLRLPYIRFSSAAVSLGRGPSGKVRGSPQVHKSRIADTSTATMRDAVEERGVDMSPKAKTREGKLRDTFFKFQTKLPVIGFGEMCYEGKEFETSLKESRPGDILPELVEASSIPPLAPPPWLISMQQSGPPPGYPTLRTPGPRAPIPEGGAFILVDGVNRLWTSIIDRFIRATSLTRRGRAPLTARTPSCNPVPTQHQRYLPSRLLSPFPVCLPFAEVASSHLRLCPLCASGASIQ